MSVGQAMTKIMNLLLLAPDIQVAILFLPRVERGRDSIKLSQLQKVALKAARTRWILAATDAAVNRYPF